MSEKTEITEEDLEQMVKGLGNVSAKKVNQKVLDQIHSRKKEQQPSRYSSPVRKSISRDRKGPSR